MSTFWAFLFFTVLCVTVYKVMTARAEQRDRGVSSADDAETMQDILRGLERMGQRVEALETLLVDRERSRSARFADTPESRYSERGAYETIGAR